MYTNELVWLSVIICLFSNLYKRSLEASRLTSRKAFALFVTVNYEHLLIFSQIQRASTLHARANQLCENTRVLAGADFHPLARSEKNEGLLVICYRTCMFAHSVAMTRLLENMWLRFNA